MSGQRYERMREDVFAAPCQNVYSEEFRRSRQRKDWCDARNDWIDQYDDDAQKPPHAHIEEMQESSQWDDNAPWRQAKERRDNTSTHKTAVTHVVLQIAGSCIFL